MTQPTHDVDAAKRYLKWLGQANPAVYTLTPSTTPGKRAAPLLRPWASNKLPAILAEHVATYYSLATPKPKLTEKAGKDELVSTRHLHVDLDPWAGNNAADELTRLFDSVTDKRPASVPAPSAIVMSGRGVQAIWALEAEVALPDGTEAVEQANRWLLEQLMGPPGTHNIDRILRLPGSWNPMDAKKLAEGFKPCQSTLFETNGNKYKLGDFGKPSPKQATSKPGGSGGSADDITEDPVYVTNLAEEFPKIHSRVRWLISQGAPGNKLAEYEDLFGSVGTRKPNDNSEWLFDVNCNLIRGGIDNGRILGLALDKKWGISKHCLKQDDSEHVARRQLARAHSAVAKDKPKDPPPDGGSSGDGSGREPRLTDLQLAVDDVNNEYFAILNGGRLQHYREQEDRVVSLDEKAFAFELAHKLVKSEDAKGKVTWTPVTKIWRSHPDRRYYRDGFLLDPHNTNPNAYNLWKGFGVTPAKGDWSLMKQHVAEVLANNDRMIANYIFNWSAWSFQNPSLPPGTALVFKGGEGLGKGMFCNMLVKAFGAHGLRIQSMRHLVGNFNAHLRHCCMLFCDEAVVPGSEGEGALKGLITEETIPIEAKGIDVVNMQNHLSVCMSSNEDYVVPAGKDARRWAVFDVSACRKGDKAYFDAILAEMKNGGVAAMLHDLLELDLTDFTPESCAPDTFALSEQKAQTLKGFERVWFDCLRSGEVPFERYIGDDRPFVSTGAMRTHAQTCRAKEEVSVTAVGKLLATLGYEKRETDRPRGFALPPLDVARKAWDQHRFKVKWDNTKSWSALDISGGKPAARGRSGQSEESEQTAF